MIQDRDKDKIPTLLTSSLFDLLTGSVVLLIQLKVLLIHPKVLNLDSGILRVQM